MNWLATWLAASPAPITVPYNPNPTVLPGMGSAADLINGVAFLAILLMVLGVVLGVIGWVVASATGNGGIMEFSRSNLPKVALGAFLIGAAGLIVSWFLTLGQHLH
jgi:hypothetical protein